MRGVAEARHNLGSVEYDYGNIDKALRHFMIAVKGGSNDTLESIQDMFKGGHVTKDDYSKALRAFQAYVGEIKSQQRDEAAAFSDRYKYY